jgi:hypothetical protein
MAAAMASVAHGSGVGVFVEDDDEEDVELSRLEVSTSLSEYNSDEVR